jgi:cobalt/nickel transport system permease protein
MAKIINAPPRPAQSSSRPRRNIIEHTLADISHTLEQSLFAEEIARRPGLLQSLDPRVKVVSILLLLIAIGLSRSLAVIVGLYFITLALAWRSSVPIGFFVNRVWLFMPFFTGIVAIPAFFITPGPPLVQLPLGLIITRTGAMTALFLLLRVGASVSAGVLLVLTTPWNSVLKALGVLRVPDVFILILGMTYRYIYLFLHTTNDMFLSRKSRIVGRLEGAEERRLIAASAGTLLSRSLHLSSEVYLAMQSRGFRGYPRTMDTWKMRRVDWVWGAAMICVVVAAIWLGR